MELGGEWGWGPVFFGGPEPSYRTLMGPAIVLQIALPAIWRRVFSRGVVLHSIQNLRSGFLAGPGIFSIGSFLLQSERVAGLTVIVLFR